MTRKHLRRALDVAEAPNLRPRAHRDGDRGEIKSRERRAPLKRDSPTYSLTMMALANPVPPVIRLRKLLKRLLRAYAFRVVDFREMTEAERKPRRVVREKPLTA